jgi:release factor glutamine methyltransferase
MNRNERWLLNEKYGGVATADYETDRRRLAHGEPLAYVIGWQPFLDLTIHLDSSPLIPRPETEWWTDQMLTALTNRETINGPTRERPTRILDLCAGSGAIGCAALARIPNAHVYFGEIDPAHETTILKNIRENGLDGASADVRTGDLFAPFSDMRFDRIAINPPYVPAGRELPRSVADHEPPLALYAGKDGLAVIRRISEELPRRMAEKGEAWIEVDSAQTETARELFAARGMSARTRTDQYGKPRVVVVSFS